MNKLSFGKFKACKIESSTIMGGTATATTYDRADFGNGATGTGKDTCYEEDGSTCVDFHDDAFVHCY